MVTNKTTSGSINSGVPGVELWLDHFICFCLLGFGSIPELVLFFYQVLGFGSILQVCCRARKHLHTLLKHL